MKYCFYFILIFAFGCDQNRDSTNGTTLEVPGTYKIIQNEGVENADSYIELNDSTAVVYYLSESSNHPFVLHNYSINNVDSNNYLQLPLSTNRTFLIQSTENGSTLLYPTFGSKDTLELEYQSKKWKLEDIEGSWVNSIYLEREKSSFPPPPIILDSIDESALLPWPPNIVLSKDTIIFNEYISKKSSIQFDPSNQLIKMSLYRPFQYYKDAVWKIKSVTDSTMIVDQYQFSLDSLKTYVIRDQLYKKQQ
ncbi:hypothetical protein [Gilvibacter sediminis]|uniref:hypothetical protein n=1 Tax=Gilvibacter sediminis TaxID=379071 RepID=UPI002350D64C|nr:hypothetical protein [Gilvibacter sediminis]MDC7997981.1 hypothetical protein [Gilvibacter sediminis]